MKRFLTKLHYLLAILLSEFTFAQNANNLDFERFGNDLKATGWVSQVYANDLPYYSFLLDSNVVQERKYSISIVSDTSVSEGNFAYYKYTLPVNFEGQKISFKCFIKTENINHKDWANLWMRIFNHNLESKYIDLKKNRVIGTKDWEEFSIELPISYDDEEIDLGLQLKGKGKVWFDNIRLFIDGKPYEEAKPKSNKNINKTDSEFFNSSKINLNVISKKQINDLSLLGKIWGFMKYHHPSIAQGNYNWDFELFKIMPSILSCSNTRTRDEILLSWIESFGTIESCVQCPQPVTKDFRVKPSFNWINPKQMSDKLAEKLLFIHQNRNQTKHYYIAQNVVGNPIFTNEATYSTKILPDVGYRLLSLFRFWNIIEYYFPYKYAIGQDDWTATLDKFIPKLIVSNDTLSYRLVLSELVANIHDSHASINFSDIYWTKQFDGYYNLPVQIIFIDNKAIVAGLYDTEIEEQTKLLVGDIILEVDGKRINKVIKKRAKITYGSNQSVRLQFIAQKLFKGFTPKVTVKVKRNGKIQILHLKRHVLIDRSKSTWLSKPDSCYRFLSSDIGYLYLGNIEIRLLPTIFEQFKNTKGIVIDMRCYPAQFVVFALSNYLLPHRKPFVKFSKVDINYPGLFRWHNRLESVGSDNANYYKGKVVILVNETTQSQAEYTTMALQTAPQAIVIGSQTAGADGDVSAFTLPGNFHSYISGIGIYYPDGRETQRVGIIPNIIVKPTIAGIKAGKDEVLEKAIEVINH